MFNLTIQVRAPTYYQKCRDQSWHITQLEANQGHYFSQLVDLKEQLSIDAAQNSTEVIVDPNLKSNQSMAKSNSVGPDLNKTKSYSTVGINTECNNEFFKTDKSNTNLSLIVGTSNKPVVSEINKLIQNAQIGSNKSDYDSNGKEDKNLEYFEILSPIEQIPSELDDLKIEVYLDEIKKFGKQMGYFNYYYNKQDCKNEFSIDNQSKDQNLQPSTSTIVRHDVSDLIIQYL